MLSKKGESKWDPKRAVVSSYCATRIDERHYYGKTKYMESDSLLICNDKGVEAEIVQAFENEDIFDQEVPQTPSLMSASRASVDSQRSVSFFVDLNDEALMAQSVTSRYFTFPCFFLIFNFFKF